MLSNITYKTSINFGDHPRLYSAEAHNCGNASASVFIRYHDHKTSSCSRSQTAVISIATAELKSASKTLLSTTAMSADLANASDNTYLRESSTEGPEEGVSQASLCCCLVLHQRRQLVVVPHKSEGPGLEQRTQAGWQGDLTSLI